MAIKIRMLTASGNYKANRVYAVDEDEASRLISEGTAAPFRGQETQMRVIRAAERAVDEPQQDTGQPSGSGDDVVDDSAGGAETASAD